MPSPFPGMNPYLEHEFVWKDFHITCMPVIRELLKKQVGDAYTVLVGEHLYIHEPSAEERRLAGHADVSVASAVRGEPGSNGNRQAAPVTVLFRLDEGVESLPNVEIRDREGNRLVTVIELLSPSNKRAGRDRDQYIRKRQEVLFSDAHFIELDLLRGGPRLPAENLPECDYYAAVSRAEDRPRVGVWPVRVRERLPKIPVPLIAPDPDLSLDLQEMLDLVYDRSQYGQQIYRRPVTPPLSAADAEWAKQFVPVAAR